MNETSAIVDREAQEKGVIGIRVAMGVTRPATTVGATVRGATAIPATISATKGATRVSETLAIAILGTAEIAKSLSAPNRHACALLGAGRSDSGALT